MRMESDEFDFLAPAYVRGFLKNYSRFLRIDPDPLLEEFDQRWGGGRVDTGQLVSLERRNKQTAPRERRRMSNWTIAAIVAGGLLLLFTAIGLIAGPDDKQPNRGTLTRVEQTPTKKPTKSPTPTASVVPTVTITPTQSALALENGFQLEIDAAHDDCWVDVTSDGVNVFSGVVKLGDHRVFDADQDMSIVLGFPEGVDLIINGQNLGTPGGVNPVTIKLPDDIDSLL
jgi:cytoskeletal protein RodZ